MFTENYLSVLWGLSPMMLVVGLFYHVTSLCFAHWMESSDGGLGIFNYACAHDPCDKAFKTDVSSSQSADWYKAAQGLEGLALVSCAACVTCGLLRVNKGEIRWQWWCALTALCSGIFALIGSLAFSLGQPRPSTLSLSYAFVFNVVGGCFCVLASPVLYIDVRWRRR